MVGTTVVFNAQTGSGFAIARGNSIFCSCPRRDDASFRMVRFLLGISHSRSGGAWSFMRLIWFQSNRRPHLAISYSFGSIRSTHARQPTPMDPVPWKIHLFSCIERSYQNSFSSVQFPFRPAAV